MSWKGILARAQAQVLSGDSSPFADSKPDGVSSKETDGDNSEAKRKVEKPEAPRG